MERACLLDIAVLHLPAQHYQARSLWVDPDQKTIDSTAGKLALIHLAPFEVLLLDALPA
jgi:hypothetical protein